MPKLAVSFAATSPARAYATMPTQAQLQADLDADNTAHLRHLYVLPAGTLSLATALTLHQGQTLMGQGRDSAGWGTSLSIGAAGQVVLAQQTGLERLRIVHSSAATLDALYVYELSGDQAGNQITLRDLEYTGGSAVNGTWAIHLKNPSEWHFEHLKLFPTGNGICLEATNDYAYNPGDGAAYNVQIRLQAGGTTGLCIAGQQGRSSGGAYAIRIPNDQSWFGFYCTAADYAGFATGGNIGIQVVNCSKVYFYGVNLEELQTDVSLTGKVGTNINAYTVSGGSGYTVADVLTFSNAHGGTAAVATVATAPAGVVATLTWTERGTLYQAGDVLTATGGAGTGAGLTVTTVGGPTTNMVRFFGSWFADAWTVDTGVTDASFDGKCDFDPTGASIATLVINGVRTGLANSSSAAQLVQPHYRGAFNTKTISQEIYALNNSGADIPNNRVCAWDSSGNLIPMTSSTAVGLFAGVSYGTLTSATSGHVATSGCVTVIVTGAAAIGDYLTIDPSNAGRVISTGTAQSTARPTVGIAVTAGTNANIVMRITLLPPAPVATPGASLGGLNLPSGYIMSSGLTWTTSSPSLNGLVAAPLSVANSVTLSAIGIDVSALGAAGCVVRLGIYSDSGSGLPGSLLIDAGTVVGDASLGYKQITINQALSPGLYWPCAVVQVALGSIAYRAVNTPSEPTPYTPPSTGATMSYIHTGVAAVATASGALPPSFGASPTSTGGAPRVFLRIA